MDKPAIKKFAVWARNKLITDTQYRAGLVGVTETAVAEPLPQSNETVQFFDVGLPQPYRIEGDAVTQRQRFVAELNKETAKQGSYTAAYQTVVDKVAYTWFNRLIAVRYMEVNDLLPSRTRVLSSSDGRAEPQIVTSPFDAVLDYTPAEQQQIVNLKNDNKLDEAFRLLFLKQCAALGDCLPRLFEQVDDYMPLLLALSFTDKDGVVCHLVNDIPESDWQDAVQIVGWLYQYYNTEPKEQVFANLKKNIKISKENIPAATQLFTPDWIVRYMVENSLGRLYVDKRKTEGIFADGRSCVEMTSEEIEEVRIENEKIIAEEMGWQYYLPEAMQAPEVRAKLEENANKDWTPESLRCIDPCMGSGHILAYLFDVLMQIYRSAGYGDRDAAASIVEHNLYGLDIDDRAAQMAYFVVMMKGCHYDSRFLRRHLNPHVYAIQESNGINRNQLKFFGNGLSDFERNEARLQLEGLLDTLTNAKEYGSILNMENYNWALLRSCADAAGEDAQMSMDSFGLADTVARLKQLIDIGEALGQKYDVVVTNPPYMGSDNMSVKLKQFVSNNYRNERFDLYTVLMNVCLRIKKQNGFTAMITQNSFMFAQCFDIFRKQLLQSYGVVNAVHLGPRAFSDISGEVVQTVALIFGIKVDGFVSRFIRLVESEDKQRAFFDVKPFDIDCNMFTKLPNCVFAYSMSKAMQRLCFEEHQIGEYFDSKAGIVTGNDLYFLRYWHEVPFNDFVCVPNDIACKYVPFSKGGTFVKWYGNVAYALKMRDLWDDRKVNKSVRRGDRSAYYKKSIGWSYMGGGNKKNFSMLQNCACGTGTPTILNEDEDTYLYTLAFLNTKIPEKFISLFNPTLNTYISDICNLPFVWDEHSKFNIVDNAQSCIMLAKSDWDSFETSWDFAEHPLVKWSHDLWDCTAIGATMAYYYHGERPEVSCPVELCYLLWQGECNDRFAKLKANEEELNRIFIDIYGLQDELTPEVEDKDVTVRRADLARDIRSLISYAVGCIFGRYSLDKPGLAYAGGDWNPDQYHTFLPDADNVIPITDEEYFTDDLTGLFVAWVKKVFGADSLEDNLAFVAKALGTKGTSPRAVIRNYFLNGFYADHIKIYQKRPIYWLYDSGKQNGFKALIYMHRYNVDTSGTVRAEYLCKMEQVYESEIARMDDAIAHGASREVAQATKRKEKLVKQLKECKDYDDRLGHIALARIPIDLDDGVKVNYDKVQTGADGKKQAILAKI